MKIGNKDISIESLGGKNNDLCYLLPTMYVFKEKQSFFSEYTFGSDFLKFYWSITLIISDL